MLSIIIPAYNEEKRIVKTLESYCGFLTDKLEEQYEIIVVVNNSTDKTINIVNSFAEDFKNIIPLELNYYTGKGGAIVEGFRKARGDYVAFVDADNSIIPEEFYKIYKLRRDYDVVISSRAIEGAKINPPRAMWQDLSSLLFYFSIKVFTDLDFYDTQCGCKIFNRKSIDKILQYENIEKSWTFDVDVLNICNVNNFTIKEEPINWEDTEGSKITLWNGFKSLLRTVNLPYREEK